MTTQHVVIVDDDKLSLKLLCTFVGELPGVVPHPFQSSQVLLEWVAGQPIDCFIIDYDMPPPQGAALTALLRAMPAFALVPIIVVTGHSEREVRYRALDAGANDFVEKPIDRREFTTRVSTNLALRRAHMQVAMRVDELAASLQQECVRAAAHAARLESLWRIVNNPALDEDEILLAMLREAAAALQPGGSFCAFLARLDGSDLVVEAAYRAEEPPIGLDPTDVGLRINLEDCALVEVVRNGITSSWNDLRERPTTRRRYFVEKLGWGSMIATLLRAGGASYFLAIVGMEPTTVPFGKEDHAYVELIGSLFATRLHAHWQWRQIRYQSEHDPLTGLQNRGQFRAHGRAALTANGGGAIAIANVDYFRQFNETYGTMIGDAVLVEIGAALVRCAEGDELVARLDGDSFGIYIPVAQRSVIERRLSEFARVFEQPFCTGDREGKEALGVTATIGIALTPHDGATFEQLLARADAATSAAKTEHRGRITFFEPGMDGREQQRTSLINELVEALVHDDFVLHFQPHVDLTLGRVSGAEALVRWNHRRRGLLLPQDFIPFAEQHGLIKGIGAWVMDRAIEAVAEIVKVDPTFRLFFNLSPVQLEDTALIDRFLDAANAGVHLENLGVEITETAAMRDLKTTQRFVSVLREHGVHIAIDDFGVGFSSLALLQSLEPDVVKIDRLFVASLLDDPRGRSIAEAIIWLGERLGYATIAEGVENPQQIEWLRTEGCHHAQGHAICRPIPLDKFIRWLEDRRDLQVRG